MLLVYSGGIKVFSWQMRYAQRIAKLNENIDKIKKIYRGELNKVHKQQIRNRKLVTTGENGRSFVYICASTSTESVE